MELFTNVEINSFLENARKHSTVEILEEGQEKKDLILSAEKRGILIQGSKDLAVIKMIYAFTDKANSNKAILPNEKFVKVLPQLVGKQLDINHDRQYIVGFYIDYLFVAKEHKAIAYAIFFKGSYPDLWKKIQKFQKAGKLSASFEIWCPENKRKYGEKGTYSLQEMEIAGGALIFEENGELPAFKDAKVLAIAKKEIEEVIEDNYLVYASKYKDEELIVAEGNISVKCLKCGYNFQTISDKVACPKCGGQIQKIEVPIAPVVVPQQIKLKCSNCQNEMDLTVVPEQTQGVVKCPKCLAILNGQTGQMIYPPQIKDFKVTCPACRIDNWLIISNEENKAHIKCLSCNKEYNLSFNVSLNKELIEKIGVVYSGVTNCGQCYNTIKFYEVSGSGKREIVCKKCGLRFPLDLSKSRDFKSINKIEEIVPIQKGGQEMLQISKYHRYHENLEELENSIKDIDIVEGENLEVSKVMTTEERNALPDNMFAVVVRVKNKTTGEMRKIRKYPMNDEAHVRNALARLGQAPSQEELQKLGLSVEKVKAKVMKRAEELKMKLAEPVPVKAEEVKVEVPKVEVVATVNAGGTGNIPIEITPAIAPVITTEPISKEPVKIEEVVVEVAKETPKIEVVKEEPKVDEVTPLKESLLQSTKQVEELTKDLEIAREAVKFYKDNFMEISKRRIALGDKVKISDIDILDDLKYAQAKADKLNIEIGSSRGLIGDKPKDADYYKDLRKRVDAKAFPKTEDTII